MSDEYNQVRKAAIQISRMYPKAAMQLPEDMYIKVFTLYHMLRVADSIEDSSSRKKTELMEMHLDSLENRTESTNLRNTLISLAMSTQDQQVAIHYSMFFDKFKKLPTSTQEIIASTVRNMTPGMLQEKFRNIQSYAQQEEYAGFVAGEVGKGLTRIFSENIRFLGSSDDLMHAAWHTGVAWQKANIIRGIYQDSQQNRFYTPSDVLSKHGLKHESFLDGDLDQFDEKIHAINELIDNAMVWLEFNIDYVKRIPLNDDFQGKYSRGIRTFISNVTLAVGETLRGMKNNPSVLYTEYHPGLFTLIKQAYITGKYWNDNEKLEQKIRAKFK